MFARKPAAPAAASASGADILTVLANPYVGAGGAGLLLLLAIAGLIAIAGDPRAGAPSIRIALETAAAQGAAPRPDRLGPGGVALDTLGPGQEVALNGPGGVLASQAIITLPQGGTVNGAAVGGDATASGDGSAAGVQVARAAGPPLAQAPIAGLSSPGPGGMLPVIGRNGQTPFQAYARPFHDNGRPKVALVIGGLGLNAASTRVAIERLPPEVTLSFVPYADGLQGWVDMARAAGHEVMLEIPMEPLDFPSNDPGPYTLMAGAAPTETVKRLEWLLARTTGYFGVTNYLGGRFVNADPAMATFTGALKSRGLAFLDDGSAARKGAGVPRASASAVIDEQLSADDIDRQLLGLEAQAQQHGSALGFGFSYPLTVDQVGRWAQALAGRGYQLAPASAITRR